MSKVVVVIDDDRVTEDTFIEVDKIEDAVELLLSSIDKDHSARMRAWVKGNIDLMIPYSGKQFGWDKADGKLVPNWKEQHAILMMQGLREQGWNYSRIARQLTKMGIRAANGGGWTGGSVKRIIAREIHRKIHDYEKPDWWIE